MLMSWKNRLIELKNNGKTYNEIADILNNEFDERFTGSRVRGWWRRNGATPVQKDVNITDLTGTSKQEYSNGNYTFENIVELIEGEEVTPDMMVKAHGLKVGMWEVVAYRNNYWQAQKKGGKKILLYQSRLTVKPLKNGIDFADVAEYINKITPLPYEPVSHHSGDCMAEVNIADLHLGKLAWHGDTGQNYDHKIARDNFKKIIADVCSRLQGRKLDYILFVWSNDYFNSDTIDKTTTGNTPQDTDVRWQKLFRVGCQLLIESIETLRQIAPVKTFYTPSNHDQMAGYYLTCVLEQKFANYEDVTVDVDAYPRKYIEYGINLLGFTHGSKENSKGTKDKASRLASTMPIEVPEQWGRTKHHEIHAAHLHCEQMIDEINGVLVRRVSSPTYSDTWHTDNAYIGAQQKAMTFIWHKDYGNIEIHNSFV
jgi:hypothetical protein